MTNNYLNFPKKAAVASLIFLLIVALFFLIGFAFDFLLLVFAGILFSTLLSFSSHWLEKKIKIKYSIALVILSNCSDNYLWPNNSQHFAGRPFYK